MSEGGGRRWCPFCRQNSAQADNSLSAGPERFEGRDSEAAGGAGIRGGGVLAAAMGLPAGAGTGAGLAGALGGAFAVPAFWPAPPGAAGLAAAGPLGIPVKVNSWT